VGLWCVFWPEQRVSAEAEELRARARYGPERNTDISGDSSGGGEEH
jgi:hypothetical protein